MFNNVSDTRQKRQDIIFGKRNYFKDQTCFKMVFGQLKCMHPLFLNKPLQYAKRSLT